MPPSGREGDHEVVEGAGVSTEYHTSTATHHSYTHSPSVSHTLDSSLRREPYQRVILSGVRDALHLGGVEPVGRHEVSGSLIVRLSRTPHPSRFTRHLLPLEKAYNGPTVSPAGSWHKSLRGKLEL